MSGVFLKEQEIKNLLNLGLGGLLRELKSMTERNMILEKKNSIKDNAAEKRKGFRK